MLTEALPARQRARQRGAQGMATTLFFGFLLLASLVGLLLVVQLSNITAAGYEVRRLQQEREDWQQINRQWETELATLQSLAYIERVAKERLGMVPAQNVVFVPLPNPPPVETATPAPSLRPWAEGPLHSLEQWWRSLRELLPQAPGTG